MANPIPILFIHLGENWIRGSETVLLSLLRNLDQSRFRPIVWCNSPLLAETCQSIEVTTYQSPFSYFFMPDVRRFDPRRYFGVLRTCIRLIREHRIRVIHANSAATLQWAVPAGLLTGTPVLGHLHNDYRRRARYVFLTHAADLLVAVSTLIAKPFLEEDNLAKERLRIVFNGIDQGRCRRATWMDLRGRHRIGPEALVLGSVGSLIRRKGHDTLLRAIARLVPELPLLHVMIAGDGEAQGELEQLRDTLGLSERVHFLGRLADSAPLYATSDFFVLASRSEGLPLVFAEAALFGLASVGTSVGGVPEAVLNGETGLLVPPDDDEALAGAIHKLATDAPLRQRLGKAAKTRAETLFTVPAMVAAFEQAYTDLTCEEKARLSTGWFALTGKLRPYIRLLTRL